MRNARPKKLAAASGPCRLTCNGCGRSRCCYGVGYDGPVWTVDSCFPQSKFKTDYRYVGNNLVITESIRCLKHIGNLADDISRINECQAVFCGTNNSCDQELAFDESQYPAIKTWVENGGRLWAQGEYNQDDTEGGTDCLGTDAREKLNGFMTALGVSLQVGFHQCNCGCSTSWIGVPGSVALVSGLPGVYHACTAEVTGGTVVCSTNEEPDADDAHASCRTSFPFIAVEALGSGFVVLTGDCNITDGCGYDNCALFRRWLFGQNSDII